MKATLAALLTVLCVQPALARPSPAYAHALRVEARREAFWHGRVAVRRASAHLSLTDEESRRRQGYWNSQQRSHALCGSYGGCL